MLGALPGNPADGSRIADDVILTNVIGFDVKAWDPTAPVLYDSSQKRVILPGEPGYAIPPAGTVSIISHGAYVDLGYLNTSYSAAYNYDITLTPNGSTHLGLGHWGHPRSGLGGTVVDRTSPRASL